MANSFLYVIGPKVNGPVKIGFSAKPEQRLKTLQTGFPETLYLHHKAGVDKSRVRILETAVHKDMSYKKTKGEWFDMTPHEASGIIEFFKIRFEDVGPNVIKELT